MLKVIRNILVFLFLPLGFAGAQEICTNSIDDDGDGLIDLNDTVDCICTRLPTSFIPNPSFEEMSYCPYTYSQMNFCNDWYQASIATSDYFNTCDFVFQSAEYAELVPFPDGNAAAGELFSPWQEYISVCLDSVLQPGVSYTLQFYISTVPSDNYGQICNEGNIDYGDIDITLFGTETCSYPYFSGENCPPPGSGWIELGSANYTPVSEWGILEITFTPTVAIEGVMVGAPCVFPPSYIGYTWCFPYFIYDNFILNKSSAFPEIEISASGNLCSNDQLLNAAVATPGGIYQWFYNGVAIPGQTDSVLNVSLFGSGEGNYSVAYYLAGTCMTVTKKVHKGSMPFASFEYNESCYGSVTGFYQNSWISPGHIVNCDWDFGDGNSATGLWALNIYDFPGTYPVTIIVTSSKGCKDTVTMNIEVHEPPSANFIFESECPLNWYVFHDSSNIVPEFPIVSYYWDFGFGVQSTLADPKVTLPYESNNSVTLIVVSSEGCSDTITRIINNNCYQEDQEPPVYIVPNVITPNGDGMNDCFCIEGLYGSGHSLVIYNRWGNRLFISENYRNDWKGEGVSDGTYYYVFKPEEGNLLHGFFDIFRNE